MENSENISCEDIEQSEVGEVRAEVALDWEALAVAFENQLPHSHSFLDLKTGKVHTVVGEPDSVPESPSPAEDFVYIRPRPSREGYRTMQRFIERVEDPMLRERLTAALVGKGAFRRFKDQLIAYPDVRQQWFAFKDAEVYAYIGSWLAREGIQPVNEPPSTNIKERFSIGVARSSDLHREIGMGLPQTVDEVDWRVAIAPYDRPEVVFRPASTALLVIDMQKVFLDPDGTSFLPASVEASQQLSLVIEACRQARVPVIYTKHEHHDPLQDGGSMARWWKGLIMKGTSDADFADDIRPLDGERVIHKARYSAFAGTPLEMILRSMNIRDLIIGGVMTNLCCESTARDAFVRDFNVFFLGDGTATADDILQVATLRNIAFGFGRVLDVAETLRLLGAPAYDEDDE